MKKSILFFFIIISICSYSQEDQDQTNKKIKVFNPEKVLWNCESTNVDDYTLQLEFIRYCNYRMYKQRTTGYILATSAVAVGVTTSAFSKNNDMNLLGSVLSGVFGIISGIILFDSEKWLKYSSIKPSNEGLGIVIRF
jgi:hypothetical protein